MKLDLYYYDSCPFCQIVLNVIKENNIKVELKNIHEDGANLKKLYQDTGRRTVPCLYIDGSPLFESLDIINFLKNKINSLEKNPI